MGYFVVEIDFSSSKTYITDLIKAYANRHNVDVGLHQKDQKILLVFKDRDAIDPFTQLLDEVVPASIFLGKSRSYIVEQKPIFDEEVSLKTPHNLAPCPACQKEMFDINSRHYYYPFTSCNSCGAQSPFLEKYPFVREHTSFRFLNPCLSCKGELEQNSLRTQYPLISCSQCGVALKMIDKKSERIANDSATYKKLFEVAANALSKSKSLLVKTSFGYKLFFVPQKDKRADLNTKLMICSADAISQHALIIKDEFNALLSIERPLVRIATQSKELKELFGASVVAQYPDDGVSMLLANELRSLGMDYIGYKDASSQSDADYLITFDLPITAPTQSTLFVNQEKKAVVDGTKISFPALVKSGSSKAVVAHSMASFPFGGDIIIDSQESACDVDVDALYVLEGDEFANEYPNAKIFKQSHASIMSVLAENKLLDKNVVGVHFEEDIELLFCKAGKPMTIIPPIDVDCSNFWDDMATLRNGSSRLVENFKERYPQIYNSLDDPTIGGNTFEIAATIIGLEQKNLEGIATEALQFLGKAGLAIDTHIQDNRFESRAFLSSILSYKLAGVEIELLCYSIFESIGDYISEAANQLCEKSNTNIVALSGKNMANQILYGRLKRNLSSKDMISNIQYPLSKENALYGALYL